MEFKLENLIDRINREKVIPIIGNELCLVSDKRTGKKITIERYLAQQLAKQCNLEEYQSESLSKIAMRAVAFNVHEELRAIYQDIGTPNSDYVFEYKNFDNLIAIKGFKTFLSVSFTDILQNRLIAKWKPQKVEVGVIENSLSPISTNKLTREAINKQYVVINLLGSVQSNTEFAITDEEYAEYFFDIMSNSSNPLFASKELVSKIKGKSFIYLGCNYPSWYVRYIIRGIRKERYKNHKLLENIFVDQPPMDPNEKEFLKKHHSFVFDELDKPDFLVDELNDAKVIEKFIEKLRVESELKFSNPPKYVGEVFISYGSENKEQAKMLASKLKAERIICWLDDDNLVSGEHEDEIKQKIGSCKVFIPIISPDLLERIQTSSKSPYVVRVEWEECKARYNAEKYNKEFKFRIIPCLTSSSIDRQDERIPQIFRAQHEYYIPADIEKVMEQIITYLQQSQK